MGYYERSIKIAFDKLSGEILDADNEFADKKDGFQTRRQFYEKKLNLSCCECEQDLNISGSKYDRLHFKHKPNHDFCILTDGNLTPKEQEGFTEILKAKESGRHKELKNKIGELLLKIEGVDSFTIAIDNKFIIRDNEKRRPDVYCKYKDKELVFEIQLSELSLGYILSRYEFYKKHGIYLIWILDNFDIHNQGTLERDIKYLTKYENFFKLDEEAGSFKLKCQYKFPFLTENNKLLTKWLDISLSLNQIHFDSESYQIYYYNFGDNKTKTEEDQKRKNEELKEAERKRIEEERLTAAKHNSQVIIKEIKRLRELKAHNFDYVISMINELDDFELEVFNSVLNIRKQNKSKKPALNQWIFTATQEDVPFLNFVLNCSEIEIDIFEKDSEGKSAFQEVFLNNTIDRITPLKGLLKRGYILTSADIVFIDTIVDNDGVIKKIMFLFTICMKLADKDLVDSVFFHSNLIFIIESAKRKEIIGFNYKPNEWTAFANNAIHHYSVYWEYIELAFKKYRLWDKLIKADKKGTFQNKVENFYLVMPQQKFDFDSVFRDIYSEIIDETIEQN